MHWWSLTQLQTWFEPPVADRPWLRPLRPFRAITPYGVWEIATVEHNHELGAWLPMPPPDLKDDDAQPTPIAYRLNPLAGYRDPAAVQEAVGAALSRMLPDPPTNSVPSIVGRLGRWIRLIARRSRHLGTNPHQNTT